MQFMVPLLVLVLLASSAALADEAKGIKSPKEICGEAKAAAKHVKPADLFEQIKAGEDVVVVDIRARGEYEAGHLPGAVWLPSGFIPFKAKKVIPEAGAKVVVYCLKGCRSSCAAVTLNEMGYKDVRDLCGGVAAWIAADLPLENLYGRIKVVEFSDADPYAALAD